MTKASLHRRLAKAERDTPLPVGVELRDVFEVDANGRSLATFTLPPELDPARVRAAVYRRLRALAKVMGKQVDHPRPASPDELAAVQE